MDDNRGIVLTLGDNEYGIQRFGPKWTYNKGTYWYLVRFEGAVIHTLARFKDDTEARRFRDFLSEIARRGA